MDTEVIHNEVDHVERHAKTSTDLRTLLTALSDSFDELWDKKRAERPDNAQVYTEISKGKQQLIEEFVTSQIAEKGAYKNVFKTEQGSVYFTLDSGESLRIKHADNTFKPQGILHKIFYVDPEQASELLAMHRRDVTSSEIIGMPIRTTDCAVGAIPIEFGMEDLSEIHFTEEPGTIIITGDDSGIFASGYHIGHPISEIL